MRVYHMGYAETMSLPMRVLWHLWAQVPRVLAEDLKDDLAIQVRGTNPEAATELAKVFEQQTPPPITLTGHASMKATEARDENAGDTLRELAG